MEAFAEEIRQRKRLREGWPWILNRRCLDERNLRNFSDIQRERDK